MKPEEANYNFTDEQIEQMRTTKQMEFGQAEMDFLCSRASAYMNQAKELATLKDENVRLREALEEQIRGAEWREENEPQNWNGSDDEALERARAAVANSPATAKIEKQLEAADQMEVAARKVQTIYPTGEHFAAIAELNSASAAYAATKTEEANPTRG